MRRRARSGRAVLVLLAALAAAPATAGAQGVQLSPVGNFSQPVYVTGAPGDTARLFVVEKTGSIRVVQGGTSSLFLDVAAAVGGIDTFAERGLLSMAFAPDYQTSGRFYVYYTAADAQSNRVAEFRRSAGNPSAADPATLRQVLSIPHTAAGSIHIGGQLQFGPDGNLYVAPGDDGDNAADAQDTGKLNGKVLRIHPVESGSSAYTIPAGNPFAGATAGADEILHLGVRNPFRFSFDRGTGDLIVADVGEASQEEVTLLPAGTAPGRNLGWPACEGTACGGAPPANYVAPALAYTKAQPRAITGGYVVRDPELPSLVGRYVYADFFEGVIRSAALVAGAGAGHGPSIGLAALPQLSSFGEDSAGRVYVASLQGGVYRLAPQAPPPGCDAYCATVTADAPRGYWRLEEASGAFADSSGHNNRLTGSSGSFARGAGGLIAPASKSVDFTPPSRLTAPDSGSLSPTGALSLEAWARPDAVGGSPNLIHKENAYTLRLEAGKPTFWLKIAGTWRSLQWGTAMAAGATHHYVATYDGASMVLYVDGVQRAARAQTGAVGDSANELSISNTQVNESWDGRIDEPAVYGQALSSTRVVAHHAAGTSGDPPPPPPPRLRHRPRRPRRRAATPTARP